MIGLEAYLVVGLAIVFVIGLHDNGKPRKQRVLGDSKNRGLTVAIFCFGWGLILIGLLIAAFVCSPWLAYKTGCHLTTPEKKRTAWW